MLRPGRPRQVHRLNPHQTPTSLTRGTAAVGLLLVASALALASCKVGPDAPPATEPPAAGALLAPAGGAIDPAAQPSPRWWLALKDPTLDALVARAEEHNQSLAAAVASVRAAYASVGASESALWPQIGAGASYSRTLTNIAQLAAAGVIVEPYDTYAYGVGLSAWEIDLWGSVRRQVEAARASAESQVDLLRDALVSVRTQVAASYLQVRTLQQQRAVLLANRDALVKSRDLVQERFDSGVTGRLDLARAEAELDGVEAEVPQVEAGLSSAIATLAVTPG
jgi:outer membrane protein TolC